MNTTLLREITDEERQQFLRDGVVCLRKIIDPKWIETTREGMEELRQAPSPYATVVDAGELYFYIDQMPSLHNDKLRRVALESGTADIAKQLSGTPQMRWLFDQLFYKGSGRSPKRPGTRTLRTATSKA